MSCLLNNGIIEVATLTPMSIQIGNPEYNIDRMLELIHEVNGKNRTSERQTRIVVYPELSVTGYSCGELFKQTALIYNAEKELKRFVKESNDEFNPIMIVGVPIRKDNQLFNCAVVIHKGKILGIVPKTFLPNYTVLYEARYFGSAINRLNDEIVIDGDRIPFTPNLLFEDERTGAVVSVELCEDLWMPLPPSAYHCLHGANIVANLSSSNQTFGKTKYRESLIEVHSSICTCGYIYTCATADETTKDSVFAGHNIIAEDGLITAETKFTENKDITYGEIDIEKIINERSKRNSYMAVPDRQEYKHVFFKTFEPKTLGFKSNRELPLLPFVPRDDSEAADILSLQATGLAQRLKKNSCEKVLIDLSGGINAILALIVALDAFRLNNYNTEGIITVMPSCLIGEENGANDLARLAKQLNFTLLELKDGQDSDSYAIRDAILRTADENNAIILGVADLSDIALGETPYNGDPISSYMVNSPVPKTAIRYVIQNYADKQEAEIRTFLLNICNMSFDFVLSLTNPEQAAASVRETSASVYSLYDFILYWMLKYGFSPKKIYDLYANSMILSAERHRIDKKAIDKRKVLDNMKVFYQNFFSRQFKRCPMPDGLKIFHASLSQNDCRMPSNASERMWIKELESIIVQD